MSAGNKILRKNGFKRVSIGSGQPHVALITGIHGDEKSPLIIAEYAKNLPISNGTLHIFFEVNQKACKKNVRYVNYDLNRIFPGKSQGTYEEVLAYSLLNELDGMDYVIDVHSFNMDSNIYTICNLDTVELARSFLPDALWLLDLDEIKYEGTMYYHLSRLKIPNMVIELPSLECVTKDHILKIRNCIDNLFQYIGILDGFPDKKIIPTYKRSLVYAPRNGIFIPYKKINETVESGDELGILIDEEYNEVGIFAKERGVLIQIRHPSIVHPLETIYALGERVDL